MLEFNINYIWLLETITTMSRVTNNIIIWLMKINNGYKVLERICVFFGID